MESIEMTSEEALKRWQRAMEALRPALETLREAMLEWWREFETAFRRLTAALLEWFEEIRREELYRRLRRWRVPHWLARFLARRWPKRWLPWPESVV